MDRFIATLGRIYFVLLFPYLAAAVGPWLLGPQNALDLQFVLMWSFTTVVFTNAAMAATGVQLRPTYIYFYTLLALAHTAVALFAALWSLKAVNPFAAVALLTVLHWSTWLWNQRLISLNPDIYKLHNRFVWACLVCHMFILMNLAYAIRQ